MSSSAPYETCVFINCPFDDGWKEHFRAIVFAVLACGFTPRCSWEQDDTGDIRIEKLLDIIKECQYGVHDLSKENARLNMPLELGLFIGCKQYSADEKQHRKKYLVFEGKSYSLKKSLTDLAGQDIKTHGDDVLKIIQGVRDWLDGKADKTPNSPILPHAPYLKKQLDAFNNALPLLCKSMRWTPATLTYRDYLLLAVPFINAKILAKAKRHK